MIAINLLKWSGWGGLFKLVAPLHLSSPLEGDLTEDYGLISIEYGKPLAARWLARQLRVSAAELLWWEITHSPWRLLGIGVVCSVTYLLILAGLTPFPLHQTLGTFFVPLVLGSIVGLIFRKRELSATISAGFLSAAGLWSVGLLHVSGFFHAAPTLADSIACIPSWVVGGIFIKLLRIRDHRIKEQVGLKADYQNIMHFEYSTVVAAPVEKVFSFHERPDAIQILTPWWLFPSVERLRGKGLEVGVELVVTTMGVSKWHARHVAFERNKLFVDEMVSGPMKSWRHEHRFYPQENGTLLTDSIDFVPIGPAWPVNFGLRMLFAFRHAVTKRYCEAAS